MASEARVRTEPVPRILLLDKPQGPTSHDAVARVRRAADTRKVGHAGTLDPMATGLLVLGVGSATRLLTHLVGLDKEYTATIRLGATSATDDAEGDLGEPAPQADLDAVTDADVLAGVAALTGPIEQVPSAVSAIKVDGRRAYDLARAGEEVVLKSRAVTIHAFEVHDIRREPGAIDVDVTVRCSSGTYIRALARDLGAGLAPAGRPVGGHLTALRRTEVGPFRVADAGTFDDPLAATLTPADAAAALFPVIRLDEAATSDLRNGKRLDAAATGLRTETLPIVAALDPAGELVGLISWNGQRSRVVTNFPTPVPDPAVAPDPATASAPPESGAPA